MMIRLFPFVLLLLLQRSSCAQSLPPSRTEPTWVMVDDRIVGELVLDTVQRRQLHEMELRYQRKYDDLLQEEDTISDEALRSRVQELERARNESIRHVLTEDQYAQWRKLVEADASRHPAQ